MKGSFIKKIIVIGLALGIVSSQIIVVPTRAIVENKIGIESKKKNISVAYVGGWRVNMDTVNVSSITHLNYSFGYIYHNEKGFDRYPGG
ncbi:MAG: hypothetical protein ACRC68_03150, partial [Clostridium sp.]